MRRDYALTPEQRIDARAALKLLEGSGVSLLDAAQRAMHGRRALKRMRVQDGADLFLREKLSKRPATADWYLSRINLFCAAFGDRWFDDITRADFREWLGVAGDVGASTKAARTRAVKALWRWAMANEPPLAVLDITGGMPTKAQASGGEIRFLSLDECAAILRGAESYRTALAIMMFAGVRPDEVRSANKPPLLWRHVNVAERLLRIPGEIAKSGRARLMEGLPDTLWRWLGKPGKEHEPVCPYLSGQAVRWAKDLAGYGPKRPWPHDGLRHTFATYHVAAFNDPGKCSMLMGHEGNPTMLHRHYRGLATKAEAEKFWALRP
jgi:integrase